MNVPSRHTSPKPLTKSVDRDLTRTITAKFADHQESGFHHPLNQLGSHSRATDIAKITKRATAGLDSPVRAALVQALLVPITRL